MRHLILALFQLFIFSFINAQNVPQGISYQGVAIKQGEYNIAGDNPMSVYWSNQNIKVRFTIYDEYPGGVNAYEEFHSTKTDDYGVFSLVIGKGQVISGDFTSVNWGLGDAHLQVEIDFENNGVYSLVGVEKFWSVPYVLNMPEINNNNLDKGYLDSAMRALSDSLNKSFGDSLRYLKSLIKAEKDSVIGNEWQNLVKNGDSLIITDGNGVVFNDDDSINEIQTLRIVNDSLILSKNGGSVYIGNLGSTAGKDLFKPSPGSVPEYFASGYTKTEYKTKTGFFTFYPMDRLKPYNQSQAYGVNYTLSGDSLYILGVNDVSKYYSVVSFALDEDNFNPKLKDEYSSYKINLANTELLRLWTNDSNLMAGFNTQKGVFTYDLETNSFRTQSNFANNFVQKALTSGLIGQEYYSRLIGRDSLYFTYDNNDTNRLYLYLLKTNEVKEVLNFDAKGRSLFISTKFFYFSYNGNIAALDLVNHKTNYKFIDFSILGERINDTRWLYTNNIYDVYTNDDKDLYLGENYFYNSISGVLTRLNLDINNSADIRTQYGFSNVFTNGLGLYYGNAYYGQGGPQFFRIISPVLMYR